MNPTATNWTPGLIVLAVGFIAAVLFLLTRRREDGAPAPEPKDGVLEDLERRYQSLIEQLKELSADRHSLPPEQYEPERKRLELEAATALRARDEHLKKRGATQDAPGPRREAPVAKGLLSPQLKGALWGGGIVLFFATLSYTLVSEQRTRGEDDAATGRVPPGMGTNTPRPQEDPELARAMERLRNDPSDLDAAALLSHELIRRQMYEEADRVTMRALAVDPFSVELRVHLGVLKAVRGDEVGAERDLMMLVDTYPDAQEALLFLGAIAMRNGDKAKALDMFERFAVEVPGEMHPPPLLAAIQQLRGELGR